MPTTREQWEQWDLEGTQRAVAEKHITQENADRYLAECKVRYDKLFAEDGYHNDPRERPPEAPAYPFAANDSITVVRDPLYKGAFGSVSYIDQNGRVWVNIDIDGSAPWVFGGKNERPNVKARFETKDIRPATEDEINAAAARRLEAEQTDAGIPHTLTPFA